MDLSPRVKMQEIGSLTREFPVGKVTAPVAMVVAAGAVPIDVRTSADSAADSRGERG